MPPHTTLSPRTRRVRGVSKASTITLTLGVLLLLIAAAGRVLWLDSAPPALQHDEIFKAQEGIALIEHGDFRLFYPTNQGHEGAFVWLLGVSYALLGQNTLMMKFPAFVMGVLTVALLYRVACEMFNRRVAFISAGLYAVFFFGLFTGRVGLRAGMLPVVALLVLWGLYRLHTRRTHVWRTAILTAAALGFAIYTYTSSLAVYGAFAAYGVALIMFDRATLRRVWRPLMLVAVIAAFIAAPMLWIRVSDPQGTNRVSTITRPLTDSLNGQPQELIDNGFKLLGMAQFSGDPEARYNIPNRPLLPFPIGLGVYVGLAALLIRVRRQPINAAWLALILFGVVPSLLTVSAPSFLRSIVALPPLMIGVALALDLIPAKRPVWILGLVAVLFVGVTDWRAYFEAWPRDAEVQRIYRDDLEQLAAYLREHPQIHAMVSTTDTGLDPTLFAYYRPPDLARVTFFDGRTNIALMAQPDTLLFVSPDSAITAPHADWLTPARGTQTLAPLLRQDGSTAYQVYRLDGIGAALDTRISDVQADAAYLWNESAFPRGDIDTWAQRIPYPVNFGGVVALVGVDLSDRIVNTAHDGVNIQLYFEPLVSDTDAPLAVFVHMARANGRVHAQRDFLGVPTTQWQTGLVFIQDNFVIAGETRAGNYMISVGVYNTATGERLPVLDSSGQPVADRVLINRVRVQALP